MEKSNFPDKIPMMDSIGSSGNPVPKEVIQGVLREYITMNKCALVHTAFVEYLTKFGETDFLSVADIQAKLKELEADADKKLQAFTTILGG